MIHNKLYYWVLKEINSAFSRQYELAFKEK